MNITDICIKRPVLAWMIMAATVVFGAVASTRIGISQYPDVDHPTISVGLTWEGAAPEAMESDAVEVIEEALSQIEGVKTVASSSRQGSAEVTIELQLSRNVDDAMQDVQARIAQVQRRLPRDMDPPVVRKSNPDDSPIMWIGLSGPFAPQVLNDIARYTIKEKLQTIPGIGEIMASGSDRNVRVWVDAARLDERGLTIEDVIAALRRQHVELPAGRLDAAGREINVRVMGEALDLATLREINVREVDGMPIKLRDVALVEDGFDDVRRLSRVNGEPAQGMGVRKQRGSNAVAVARAVRATLKELEPRLPAGMKLGINFDSTVFVEESVEEVEFELVLSVLLTAVVCWFFLGSLSSAINVVLAIPMSLLGTVAFIYFAGFTLNTFTLLALALAVGIVVDDAIMVLENIHRHRTLGKSAAESAASGTHEVKFAAFAATLAVIAIFVPVVFMEGVIGRFFLEFGITFCVAVLLSYLEAITLAPARAAQLSRGGGAGEHVQGLADRGFAVLARGYAAMLARSMRHPAVVLVAALGICVGAFFVFRAMPSEFAPSQDQGRLMVRLQTEVGSNLAETDKVIRRAEAIANRRPEIARAYVVVGSFQDGAVNSGMMFLTLVPKEKRMDAQTLSSALRKELSAIPGLRATVQDMSTRGFTGQRGYPVDLSIRGPDWNRLTELGQTLRDRLAQSGTVVDADTDFRMGMPELRIAPDRARSSDVGVSIESVATTVNALVGGVRVGKYNAGGRRIDVRLRLLADQRSRPEHLRRLKVRGRNGELIPIATLVSAEERPALQAITRMDRERSVSVFGNVAPGFTQNQALALASALARELPSGYRIVPSGASLSFRESMNSLYFALVLGVLVAYMILASQFNSLLHPITVLTVLPLSVAGAVFALYPMGFTINIFSMIGLLLLLGIVKKNSIILVDYANQVRDDATASGRSLDAGAAMLEAAPVRLRPILMTAFATIMAAVPPAFGWGPGAEIRKPMAAAVIGGMLLSTALSLFVVPAFYAVVSGRVGRKRTRPAPAAGDQQPGGLPEAAGS